MLKIINAIKEEMILCEKRIEDDIDQVHFFNLKKHTNQYRRLKRCLRILQIK